MQMSQKINYISKSSSTKSNKFYLTGNSIKNHIGWSFIAPSLKIVSAFKTSRRRDYNLGFNDVNQTDINHRAKEIALRAKITQFGVLPDNWNGNHAAAISNGTIQQSLDVLGELLPYEPSIFPTARNTIQFEFEDGDMYLEFEVYEDKVVMLNEVGDEQEEREVRFKEIEKIVTEFHVAAGRGKK